MMGSAFILCLATGLAAPSAWTVVDTPWPDGSRPVALATGEAGEAWMVDAGPEGGLGAVWRLTDSDGDRRFESAVRFAAGVIAPRAVLGDGAGAALVLEPPNLVRLADTDGDGRADASRIVAKAAGATGLARGSDGWVRLLGAGVSVRLDTGGIRTRRSWPMTGAAVERSDGTWLSADGDTVVVVAAADHAIVRNPAMPAPWGTVAVRRVDGPVVAIEAEGDDVLLVEKVGDAFEMHRRSVALDGPRLSLGIPEVLLAFPRQSPFAMARLRDGSIAIGAAEGMRVAVGGLGRGASRGPIVDDLGAHVLAVGEDPDAKAFPTFTAAFLEAGDDKYIRDSIVAGLAGREMAFLAALLAVGPEEGPGLNAFRRSVADSVLESGREAPVRRLIEFATTRPDSRDAILARVLAATEPNARLRRTLFVDLEPEGWRSLVGSGASPAAAAIDPHLRWPGRDDLPPLPDPDADLDLVELGRRTYSTCVTCHGSGGRGQPGIYPPLKGSDWVLGDPRRLVRIMIHGLQGPILVNGEPYSSVMQLPRPLTDREIAAVLTYIRQAWGNDAVAVEESLVREIRSTTASRNVPWTSPELDEVLRGTAP